MPITAWETVPETVQTPTDAPVLYQIGAAGQQPTVGQIFPNPRR